MAAVDAAAPEPVEVLIERAGAAVARVALELLGGSYGRRVTVLAGKGNNGADGRAAAASLRRRGVRVEVVDALKEPERLRAVDLVIDAAYGTGFRGDYDAPLVVEGQAVLAVDIPSGVDGLTGEAVGRVLEADVTVTFAAVKPGLLLGAGRRLAGAVVLADIDLDVSAATCGVVEGVDVEAWVPERSDDAHKWKAAVLVVAGSPGMTGAARLAASAAQRAGAGMVRVGSPGVADDAGRPLEAVGLELPSTGWSTVAAEHIGRFGALVLGPGLGRSDDTTREVRALLGATTVPVVVDGDGLTALGADAAQVIAGRSGPLVVTPHDGEFERLAGHAPPSDRLTAVRALAADLGAVVLLKGPTTVVADPEGSALVVLSGDARLATAGTGDVLSGIIAALLARGVDPLRAAAAGAWLHGRAGAQGPEEGLVASDLIDALPAVWDEVRS